MSDENLRGVTIKVVNSKGRGQILAEEGQILPLSLLKCISCTILVAMVIHYVT